MRAATIDRRTAAGAEASLDVLTASLVARQSRTNDGSMSVPDQVEKMKEFCERNGWHVGAIYEEPDVSGRRPLEKRHGLKSAVVDVEEGRSQVVLTAYFDRFVRSVATRAEVVQRVEKKKGRVVTLDMGETSDATAADWLSGTMLAAISEFYARQVGEKLMTSKQRNIDRGIPPFPRITPAYERIATGEEKGRLRPHPTNAPLVREAIRMRIEEQASYVKLARWLSERGLAISPSGVEQMFASKLLIGEIHFGDFRPNLDAIDEPIVDRATFRKLNATKATRGRYAKSERLLARLGVLVCECGARMVVHSTKSKSGPRYNYYECGDRLCSAPARIGCDVAEEIVRDEAIRLSADVEGRASAADELEAARLAREEAESALANAIRTLASLAGEAATKETLDELQAQRDVAVERHERLLAFTSPDATVRTRDDWDRISFEGKRDVIRAVVARAIVAPGRGPGRVAVEGRTLLGE